MPSETVKERASGAAGTLEIVPLTPVIGAEVRGVKLNALSDDAKTQIYRAWLQHKVLFFRGQADITIAQHEDFAAMFGEPTAPPTIPVLEGSRYVLELDSRRGGRADQWHTDATFTQRPDKATVLRSMIVPEALGDTLWANTAAAYESLPEPLKRFADSLWIQHANDRDPTTPPTGSNSQLTQLRTKTLRVEHPAVHVHPETGERALMLGYAAQRLIGFPKHESSTFFDILEGYVQRHDHVVRWRWQVGDVVVWDNRVTEHIALQDYGDRLRIMHRVSVRGDIPVSLNGRQESRVLDY